MRVAGIGPPFARGLDATERVPTEAWAFDLHRVFIGREASMRLPLIQSGQKKTPGRTITASRGFLN